MDYLLNFEELAVFLSLLGGCCLWSSLRVKKSEPWQESAVLKRVLLVLGAAVLQIPVVLVVWAQPPCVTAAYSVETFSVQRLLLDYVVQAGFFLGVGVFIRWLE